MSITIMTNCNCIILLYLAYANKSNQITFPLFLTIIYQINSRKISVAFVNHNICILRNILNLDVQKLKENCSSLLLIDNNARLLVDTKKSK